jgi:hypothetical protein
MDFLSLCNDILRTIMTMLVVPDAFSCSLVCKRLQRVWPRDLSLVASAFMNKSGLANGKYRNTHFDVFVSAFRKSTQLFKLLDTQGLHVFNQTRVPCACCEDSDKGGELYLVTFDRESKQLDTIKRTSVVYAKRENKGVLISLLLCEACLHVKFIPKSWVKHLSRGVRGVYVNSSCQEAPAVHVIKNAASKQNDNESTVVIHTPECMGSTVFYTLGRIVAILQDVDPGDMKKWEFVLLVHAGFSCTYSFPCTKEVLSVHSKSEPKVDDIKALVCSITEAGKRLLCTSQQQNEIRADHLERVTRTLTLALSAKDQVISIATVPRVGCYRVEIIVKKKKNAAISYVFKRGHLVPVADDENTGEPNGKRMRIV